MSDQNKKDMREALKAVIGAIAESVEAGEPAEKVLGTVSEKLMRDLLLNKHYSEALKDEIQGEFKIFVRVLEEEAEYKARELFKEKIPLVVEATITQDESILDQVKKEVEKNSDALKKKHKKALAEEKARIKVKFSDRTEAMTREKNAIWEAIAEEIGFVYDPEKVHLFDPTTREISVEVEADEVDSMEPTHTDNGGVIH